ncbi:MAG TPA: hypothetical protein VG742_20715 [Dongiaceae bacterium]|nr:hypothetical protein [Dongiaceae bacterium]
MPRRFAIDRPATASRLPGASPLRRLWRHFLAATLDRQVLERLSPHELRDIGLPERGRGDDVWRDRFRDLL